MKKIFIICSYAIAVLLAVKMKNTVCAEEQAQVIYDFMEMSEDVSVYEEPNYESKTDTIIPEGENVLILSQTSEGWYQILYHGEIFYIIDSNKNMTEMQVSEDVVDEMEEHRAEQELTEEEMQEIILEEETNDAPVHDVQQESNDISPISEHNHKSKALAKILLGTVGIIVLLSGTGYWYINKKEKIEQIKKTEQTDIYIQDLDKEK